MITVFKTMNSHGTPEYFEIDEVLGRIKRGVNKSLIDQIRKESYKPRRDELKKKLLWICFSGKFSARLNESLIEHSGFICLDFDGIESKELTYWKGKIKADKHTYCVFISPSGNGLKAIWKIPACKSNDEHNQRFEAISAYWKDCKYFDNNVKGWNRVCFESYDPDIVINHNSEVFRGIADVKAPVKNIRKFNPIADDSGEIFNRVVAWFEKNHNLNKGNRDQGAFIFASGVADYLPESIGFDYAVDYIMANVEQISGDQFTISEAEKCVRNAYKHTPVPRKSFNLNTKQEPVKSEKLELIEDTEPIEKTREKVMFWYLTSRGAVKIDFYKLQPWLESEGFFRYDFAEGAINFIHKQENIIESVTANDIKNFVLNCLREWGEDMVFNAVFENSKFEDKYLSCLSFYDPKFLEDTREESWFFFRNGAVKVTKEAIEVVKYIDIEGCIWKSAKIDRDFEFHNFEQHDFAKFLTNICANDPKRLQSLLSGIGYELHRFKDPSNVKGLILIDETNSDKPMGGTGKTLVFEAIGHLREVVVIDAKDYDGNNRFALQRVKPSTNIIVFDDPPRNFKIERLFSKMSTGLPINQLYKGETYLPFEKSPKYGFPSNYVFKGESDSFKRRKFEAEIHPHYSATHQPIDEFGRSFWKDQWTEADWMMFDSLMLSACQLFLKNGLIQCDYVNLNQKKFEALTSSEFAEWAAMNIENNNRYHRNSMYEKFKEDEPGAYLPSSKIFYEWLREWGNYNKWTVSDAVGGGRMYIEFGESQKVADIGEINWNDWVN